MGLRFVLRPSRNIYHNGTPQDFPGVLVGSNTVIVVLVSCPMNSFGLQWISNWFVNKLSIASWIIISFVVLYTLPFVCETPWAN